MPLYILLDKSEVEEEFASASEPKFEPRRALLLSAPCSTNRKLKGLHAIPSKSNLSLRTNPFLHRRAGALDGPCLTNLIANVKSSQFPRRGGVSPPSMRAGEPCPYGITPLPSTPAGTAINRSLNKPPLLRGLTQRSCVLWHAEWRDGEVLS